MALDAAPFPLFLRAADAVAGLVAAARDGVEAPPPEDIVLALERLRTGESPAPAAGAGPAMAAKPEPRPEPKPAALRISIDPRPDLFRRAVDPRHIFAALEELGALRVDTLTEGITPLAGLIATDCRLRFRLELTTEASAEKVARLLELQLDAEEFAVDAGEAAEEPLASPEPEAAPVAAAPRAQETPPASQPTSAPRPSDAPAKPQPRPAATRARQGQGGGSIRVDLDRIDRLMNLVGEIVITQSMLDQRLLALSVAETMHIADGLQMLSRQTRELQESVMAVRAQPVKNVFQRMPRLVRELAQALGKQARLHIVGEDTEVDKTIIEELSDPLTHMIRKLDGSRRRDPDERVAAGKPPEGVVTLMAEQRSGRIVITVGDDGRGVNRERLLAKAKSRGLIAPDARLAPEDIDALLFHPGLSTAEAVTDVSGRGVGMDVVKQNVEALGGRVTLQSEPGKGTRFTLLLPLTLAVMDGMIIRAAGSGSCCRSPASARPCRPAKRPSSGCRAGRSSCACATGSRRWSGSAPRSARRGGRGADHRHGRDRPGRLDRARRGRNRQPAAGGREEPRGLLRAGARRFGRDHPRRWARRAHRRRRRDPDAGRRATPSARRLRPGA